MAKRKNPPTPLGERIRALYEPKQLSAAEFAAIIGIKPPSLSELESREGANPSVNTAHKIAVYGKITIEALMDWPGPKLRPLADKYPDDVVDIATQLCKLSKADRDAIRVLADQLVKNAEQQRIGKKRDAG